MIKFEALVVIMIDTNDPETISDIVVNSFSDNSNDCIIKFLAGQSWYITNGWGAAYLDGYLMARYKTMTYYKDEIVDGVMESVYAIKTTIRYTYNNKEYTHEVDAPAMLATSLIVR